MICKVCDKDLELKEFRGRSTCRKCENKQRVQRKYSKLKVSEEYRNTQREYDAKRKRDKRTSTSKDSIIYIRESMSSLIRKSITSRGFTKKTRTYEILGCSYEFIREHISKQFKEGMSWDNHGEWHIDHIIPSCSGNTYDKIILLNHYTNFQPLWSFENFSKSGNIL